MIGETNWLRKKQGTYQAVGYLVFEVNGIVGLNTKSIEKTRISVLLFFV